MSDLEKALHDPSSVYDDPMRVIADTRLTREQKVLILRQWEYDAREFEVADEENMPNNNEINPPGSILKRVLEALHTLGEKSE